ncbi:MAG: hypothetical protein ACREM2_05645, partial [Vulcanimicrobiaceae bacterium]
MRRALVVGALAALVLAPLGARAARPLLDQPQWDRYFALFARDVELPWRPATIRLDTYSGAPVELAAYNVDPAAVIVEGANRPPRPIDTTHRKPLVRWRFVPPPGYHFESNQVTVPLGSQEGFYVIEARRGDARQQVWLNRTHIGLVTLESPQSLALWGVDLRNGRPLRGMKIAFLAGAQVQTLRTDGAGLVSWRGAERPSFALAEDGAGRAFVSLLPQPPLPHTLVAIRAASASVRAGESLRFAGFVRTLGAQGYRAAGGSVQISFAGSGRTIATTSLPLDSAGAFSGALALPATLSAGDDSLLASALGGVGGVNVHVDAARTVTLAIENPCPCDPARPVTVGIAARSVEGGRAAAGIPLHVQVVRSPHVIFGASDDVQPRWGTTLVLARNVHTDADGTASVTLLPPSDGLDSTYGIEATTAGASASAQIVVPQGSVALSIVPQSPALDVGEPAKFEVRAFDPSDGTPVGGLAVRVTLSHGVEVQSARLALDVHGRGEVTFAHPNLGSDLAIAHALADGKPVLDATAVSVAPRALLGTTASAAAGVSLTLDRERYRPGERIVVHARSAGASGSALFALDGARTYLTRVVPVSGGAASATLTLPADAQGDVRVSAAFVSNGAIALGETPLVIDGPGHPRALALT